jgi:putative transcriptional regulator
MTSTSQNKFNSLEGKILVASPKLKDTFFKKALLYIFMHDEKCALGMIFNHKIGTVSTDELLKLLDKKDAAKLKCKDLPIMFGGPINTEKIIALSISKEQEKFFSVSQSITLHSDIESFIRNCMMKSTTSKFLLVRGFSAWGANQLENELAENSWFITQPSLDLLFSQKTKDKWASVIAKLGLEDHLYIVPYTGNA